jgi:ADP-heptose:LPS heptosyltransferase
MAHPGKIGRAGKLRRAVDFLFGVPLVFFLGTVLKIFRCPRIRPFEIREIGLLQTAAIGDTVIMSGIWRDLRELFPQARISVLVGESNYDIAELLFGAENVHLLPVKKPLIALQLARRQKFDVLLDFGPWPRWNAFLAAMIPAKFRVGYATYGQYRHYVYDRVAVHSSRVHEIDNQRALLAALDLDSPKNFPGFPLDLPQEERSSETANRIVLHAWSGGVKGFNKQWPEERWVELSRLLHEAGFDIELSGAPSDQDNSQALAEKIRSVGIEVNNLAGRLSLKELVHRLRTSYAVISVDTGIMHIAAAIGAVTFGLHGPTPARRWRALGPRAYGIETSCPGCGFLDLGFEYPKAVPPCMGAITASQVFGALMQHTATSSESMAASASPESLAA